MPNRAFLTLFLSFSIFVINACVSIPEHVHLVNMESDRGISAVNADCQYQPKARNIPVSMPVDGMLDSNNISLLNWNVYKGQRENWASDFKQLIQHQDIVVLQEANLKQELHQSLKKQGLNWSLNTAFYYEDAEAGVLTASRVKAKRVCGMRTTEPLIRTPKTMLVSEYHLSNTAQTLLVANIHGINFTLGTETYQEQIEALTEAVRSHKGPVIVAGDFNTWSDSRMDIVNAMADQLSLEAVSFKSHNRITAFGNPLDHVYYRGLDVIKEASLEVDSSDHNPILVTFKVAALASDPIKL